MPTIIEQIIKTYVEQNSFDDLMEIINDNYNLELMEWFEDTQASYNEICPPMNQV